jgi:hypothetical protein
MFKVLEMTASRLEASVHPGGVASRRLAKAFSGNAHLVFMQADDVFTCGPAGGVTSSCSQGL